VYKRKGFYGGRIDDVMMRFVDIMCAFTGLVLAIGIAGLLGPSSNNAMIAIGIVYAPAFARVVRRFVAQPRLIRFQQPAALDRRREATVAGAARRR